MENEDRALSQSRWHDATMESDPSRDILVVIARSAPTSPDFDKADMHRTSHALRDEFGDEITREQAERGMSSGINRRDHVEPEPDLPSTGSII